MGEELKLGFAICALHCVQIAGQGCLCITHLPPISSNAHVSLLLCMHRCYYSLHLETSFNETVR